MITIIAEAGVNHNGSGSDLYPMLVTQRNGNINSWAIRFALNHSLHNKLGLFPTVSFATNIGHDNSGTHCGDDKHWLVSISEKIENREKPVLDFEVNNLILKNFNKDFIELIFGKFKRLIKALK